MPSGKARGSTKPGSSMCPTREQGTGGAGQQGPPRNNGHPTQAGHGEQPWGWALSYQPPEDACEPHHQC